MGSHDNYLPSRDAKLQYTPWDWRGLWWGVEEYTYRWNCLLFENIDSLFTNL